MVSKLGRLTAFAASICIILDKFSVVHAYRHDLTQMENIGLQMNGSKVDSSGGIQLLASDWTSASSPGGKSVCVDGSGTPKAMRADGFNFGTWTGAGTRRLKGCEGKWVDWKAGKPRKWTSLADQALMTGEGLHSLSLLVPMSNGEAGCAQFNVAIKIGVRSEIRFENATVFHRFKSDYILRSLEKASPPRIQRSGDRWQHMLHGRSSYMKVASYMGDQRYEDVSVLAVEAATVSLEHFAQFEEPSMVPQDLWRRTITATASPTAIANIARDVLRGIQAIHKQNYAHADVRPGNILLMCPRVSPTVGYALGHQPEVIPSCRFKLSGLGLACRVAAGSGRTDRGEGYCEKNIGTDMFHSPSLKAGAKRSRTDDLWALGVSLLSLLMDGETRLQKRDPSLWRKDEDVLQMMSAAGLSESLIGALMYPCTHCIIALINALMYPKGCKDEQCTNIALKFAESIADPAQNGPPPKDVEDCWKQQR